MKRGAEMKRLQAWMVEVPMRQVHIWWHWRHSRPGPEQFTAPADPEIWWHVELHEYEPLEDHGQRQQAGGWTKTEHVWVGYDADLNKAISKALKRTRGKA
jgi:hypothetical protein